MLGRCVAAVVAAVMLAACSGSSPSTAARASSTSVAGSSAGTRAAAPPPGSRDVALGSSFAAGPGIPDQSGGLCARSDHNYPHLVAAALHLDLVDVSCSGATTANVLDQTQGGNAPQIDSVTGDTRIVTLTVGGNDIQYSAAALLCGSSRSDCLPSLDTSAINTAVAALPARLDAVIVAIHRRAPAALVVLVTYPQVVPAEGAKCAALRFDAAEANFIRQLGQRLENVFLGVARSSKVVLVDAYAASIGHGPCAPPAQSWVDGLRPTVGFPYHPNRTGHEAMAALVVRALQHL